MTQRSTPMRGQDAKSAGRNVGMGSLRIVGSLMGFAARRPAIVLASVALFGGAGVFAWNATMTQSARHPAPLFAGSKVAAAKPEVKPEPPRRAEALQGPLTTGTTRTDVPAPPARPAGTDAIGSIIKASEEPGKAPEAKAKSAEAKPKPLEAKKVSAEAKSTDAKPKVAEVKAVDAKPKAASDPKTADAKTADAKPAEAKPQVQPRVATAQKALVKLGYGPITADGLLGSGTRQALEKFERDKKLPVTGGLGPRTSKQLASLSGFTIE